MQVVLNQAALREENVRAWERRQEMEELAGERGMDTRNGLVRFKKTIKWLNAKQGTTWCEKI